MTATLDSLFRQSLGLSPDQRVSLARQLLDSVEPGAEDAWEAEIADRLERYKAGASPSIPAEEVFARLRRVAPWREAFGALKDEPLLREAAKLGSEWRAVENERR